jgi:hypothetical protein
VLDAAPLGDTTDITAVLVPVANDPSLSTASATPVAAPVVTAPAVTVGKPTTGAGAAARQVGAARALRLPVAPTVRFLPAPTSAVDAVWHTRPPASSEGRQAPARRPEASPRRSAPPAPARPSVISVSGVSAAAASGGSGGSSGSGLPLLLTLPFVAALLDLARRVALEHATWPPGHRRRVPDRPG